MVSASSAELAVAQFHSRPFVVVIADHGLPGDNGINLPGQIKKMMPYTLRVLLTASNDPQVLRDAINIGGGAHFLSKPINPDALKHIVDKACWNTLASQQGTEG